MRPRATAVSLHFAVTTAVLLTACADATRPPDHPAEPPDATAPPAPFLSLRGVSPSARNWSVGGITGNTTPLALPTLSSNASIRSAAFQAPPAGTAPASPGVLTVAPGSPTEVNNCIPFGDNVTFGFTGFIYRNVPSFTLRRGDQIAFDLGGRNDVPVRRNIYLAAANKNPQPAEFADDLNIVSQGVRATGWTRIVSEGQLPRNARGNLVVGDFELTYTAEAPFVFAGGGFTIGFGGTPPGVYVDGNCDPGLVGTTSVDASGQFYARFFHRPEQDLTVLDVVIEGGGNGVALGGFRIIPATREPAAPLVDRLHAAVLPPGNPTGLAGVWLRVRLRDPNDAGPWDWRIDWGDGAVNSPQNVKYTGEFAFLRSVLYTTPGPHTIAVTATDPGGLTSAAATTTAP
jgi:hypothetical protein